MENRMTDHFWMRRKELLGDRQRKPYAGSRLARDLEDARASGLERVRGVQAAMRRLAAALDRMGHA